MEASGDWEGRETDRGFSCSSGRKNQKKWCRGCQCVMTQTCVCQCVCEREMIINNDL